MEPLGTTSGAMCMNLSVQWEPDTFLRCEWSGL